MKKLIDSPDNVVADALVGIEAAAPTCESTTSIASSTVETHRPGKVGLISGGGSGHEPLHGGFVGLGMLDAACAGEIFTSPDARPDGGGDEERRRRRRRAAHREELHRRRDELRDGRRDRRRRLRRRVETVVTDDDVAVQDSLYTAAAAASASPCCWRRSPGRRPRRAATSSRRRPGQARERLRAVRWAWR